MAVTETRPGSATETLPDRDPAAPVAPAAPAEPTGLAGLVGSADHKTMGRLWLATSLLFLLVAGVAGALVSAERLDPSSVEVLGNDAFLQTYTLHSVSGIFLFLLPALLGLATYVVPLQVGASTIAFPRAAAMAFWTHLLAGTVLLASYAVNGGPYGGDAAGVDLWLVAFGAVLVALLVGTVCVLTTVFTLRAPGMTLARVPMFSWSMLVGGALWLLTLPALLATVVLLYVDHRYGRVLLGGNFGIYPRVLWAVGQPQVYAYAVPALGIVAEVVPVSSRVRQASAGLVMTALALVGLLGFGAFAQPAFAADVEQEAVTIFFGIVVLVPVLLLVALWADTVRRGRVRLDSAFLFSVAAVLMFVVGAAAGAIAVITRFDLRGTTWDAGHVHYVLMAATIALVGGLHWWGPKIWGRTLAEGAGKLTAVLLLLGTVGLSFPDLVSGVLDQPARSPGGDVRTGVEALNWLSALGGLLVLVAVVVFLLSLGRAAFGRRDPEAPADPWEGHTLEWATSSPPPRGNFTDVPDVTSDRPLLDGREPAEAVEADR